MSTGQELLTLEEASRRFGVPIPTLRYWRKQGWISRFRRGDNVVLVAAADVDREVKRRQHVTREDDQQQ